MKTKRIGYLKIPVYRIPIEYKEGENWQFTWIDAWADTDKLTTKKQMAIF